MALFQGIRTVARGESTIDFVGKARVWFAISGVLLLASIGGLVFRGLNLGLEFKGGSSFTVPVASSARVPTVPAVEEVLKSAGVPVAQVQIVKPRSGSGATNILVQARHVGNAAVVTSALAKVAGQTNTDLVSVQDVGPKWGQQISKKALRGLIAFLVLVVLYISLRFEPKMAVAGFAAVLHDLVATFGIYALVGFQVTPATVIAVLTILGYSLYDDVVVFDKVRENVQQLGGSSKMTYSETVNRSVNQVLMRSINTSLTSLLPVGGLLIVGAFLLGAATLKDLALALFVGITVGTYSSIFVAIPILALWKEREPRYQQIRARAMSARGAGARSATGRTRGAGAEVATAVAVADAVPATDAGEDAPREKPRARAPERAAPRKASRQRGRKRGRARRHR